LSGGQQKNRIELYPTQYDFVDCQDRFTAFIAGIGSGKSFAGAVKGLAVGAKTKGLGLVVSPTYPMLRDATLRSYLMVFGDAITEFYKSEMRAALLGGGEILFRSADKPDRLRGPNLSWAHIDEGGLCPPGTWDIVIGRLREGGKAGPCWVTGTPKGRNWLYEKAPQMTVFRAATKENPYLAAEFIHSLEAAYTGQFARQELFGEFVTFEGRVYEEFDHAIHVQEREGPWPQVIAGMDEGYTNPSAILVIGLDNDGRAHLIEEFYQRRVLQGDVVGEAKRLREAHKIEQFYIDPSAAGLAAEMRSVGLPVLPSVHEVKDGIQQVKARLVVQPDKRPRLTVSPSCANTIAEFESYIWKEGKQGMKDEPEKLNDHSMDALRYALATPLVQPAQTAENPFY